MFLIILKILRAVNIPTPAPMQNTIKIFELKTPVLKSWVTKTETSGSAIVAKNPNIAAKITKIISFESLFTVLTISSPIGIMVESTPVKNNASPKAITNAETKNPIKSFVSIL